MSSSIERLEAEHNLFYREHKVEQTSNGYCCTECGLNAWADNFPEYCIGPTTEIDLGSLDTNDEYYKVFGKIFHLHNKALIEFRAGGVLDDGFILDIDACDLDELIEKLNRVREQLT